MRTWLILLAAPLAFAQTAGFERLQTLLKPMRQGPAGAAPAAEVKRELRAEIEYRLGSFGPREDEQEFARQMNSELRSAGLLCDGTCSGVGYLQPVSAGKLENGRFLIVQTGLSQPACGPDRSVYVYQWFETHWENRLSEENPAGHRTYDSVLISGPVNGRRLILTLGHTEGCDGASGTVAFRVWAARNGMPPDLILEDSDPAGTPIRGRVRTDEVWIEYSGSASQDIIRHYIVNRYDQVRRAEPFALTPAGFVQEWLRRDWSESSQWTEEAARSFVESVHKSLRGNAAAASAFRCENTPGLWQVEQDGRYFFVRWREPYTFTLIRIGDAAAQDCRQPDPEAGQHHSLLDSAR